MICDALRLLKVDVLGLGMLSCLRRGFDLLRIHYRRSDTIGDSDRSNRCQMRRNAGRFTR